MSGNGFSLGGSSFAQIMNALGTTTPTITDPLCFKTIFNTVQGLITSGHIIAGHDISAGGMIVALLEMTFSCEQIGLEIDLSALPEPDVIKILYSENPGILIQVNKGSPALKYE